MSDERGAPPWRDGHDRQPRHHPGNDRGHSVLRGGAQPDEWTDVYGNQPQDPRGRDPRAQDRGYGDYRDQGYAQQPGYGTGGYDQGGYEQGGYNQGGYPPGQQPGYPAGGRGYPAGHDPRHPDPRHPDPDPGYPDPGYPGQGYPDAGYADQGYPDQGYDQYGRPVRGGYGTGQHPTQQDGRGHEYGDQGYDSGDQGGHGYADPRYGGYPDRGRGHTDPHGAQMSGQQPRTGRDPYFAGSNTGSFIEQGFDEMLDDRMTTTGRGRRLAAPPPRSHDDDFYEPDDGPEKRKRGRSTLVFVIVILMLGGIGGGVYFGLGRIRAYFGDTPDYTGKGTAEVVNVQVHQGDSTTAIANTLLKLDVVKSTKAFTDAAKKDPNSLKIQPGWYKMHKQMSAQEALTAMEALGDDGQPLNAIVYTVAVTEGEISVDIFADLAKVTGKPVKEFSDAAKNPVALGVDKSWFVGHTFNNRPFIKSIEGFLFPATYKFQPDDTPTDMLKAMVAKFNDEVKPGGLDIAAAAHRLGMTPYEVLITASIAQAEAQRAPDMAGVARVIYNRIYKTSSGDVGTANLGIDSEVNYWLRITGHSAKDSEQLKVSELHAPNDPYNSHDKPGLPGGAIGNPGADAINGAMNPAVAQKLDYYWQTVGTDPKVLFAKTFTEFTAQQK